MSAIILPFKAPERAQPRQGERDPEKAALVLSMLRQIAATLEAQQRGRP